MLALFEKLETTSAVAPPLLVTMAATEVPVGKLRYDLTVRNPSGLTASSVVVSAPVPEGMSFVTADHDGRLNGEQVRWEVGTLAAGAV